jgi:hypothetical protein
MLIAFYVPNGKQLPIWKDFPYFTYWLVPLAVATPIIVWALLRHPLARASRLAGQGTASRFRQWRLNLCG